MAQEDPWQCEPERVPYLSDPQSSRLYSGESNPACALVVRTERMYAKCLGLGWLVRPETES